MIYDEEAYSALTDLTRARTVIQVLSQVTESEAIPRGELNQVGETVWGWIKNLEERIEGKEPEHIVTMLQVWEENREEIEERSEAIREALESWKVIRVSDGPEWWVGRNIEEVALAYANLGGDSPDIEPFIVPEEALDRMVFADTNRTFREELERMIEAGIDGPQEFAASEH